MEGIEGIDQDILVKVVNGWCGLVHAPLHWRKILMVDPCTFLAHDLAGRLTGAIAIGR